MSKENKKLEDFIKKDNQPPVETAGDSKKSGGGSEESHNKNKDTNEYENSSTICDCYHKIRREYQEELRHRGITPPECGHCIEYLCKGVSAGTASTYNGPLRMFIEYLHEQGVCISSTEYIHVRDFFESQNERQLAESTLGVYKSSIKGVLTRYEAENEQFPVVSWKVANNIDPSNYGGNTTFEREPLSDKEIELLLRAANDFRNKIMMLTGIETGARDEATRSIKISDVKLEESIIELKNTKYGRKYTLPLTDGLTALLEHWIEDIRSSYIQGEDNQYLFPSRHGGKMSDGTYREIVDTAAEKAGIQEEVAKIQLSEGQKEVLNTDKDYRVKKRVDIHTLRHTFSRLLKENDISKDVRTYALDHTPDVTDGYGTDEEASRKEIRDKFEGVDVSRL
ncbi:tyrosine-type recombinase/integrase [Halorubrum sp. RMP-47]|uniref:Tyrosine-type recombinase/integrase n=1 Tax=Halorubrum miltondacostae TaxID=3076378 RepID=A0ABD5LWD0_9EURY